MRFRRRLVLAALVAALFVPVAGCASGPSKTAAESACVWPDCVCGDGFHALTLLDQIQVAATDAYLAQQIDGETYERIITLVTRCRGDYLPYDDSKASHCKHVLIARNAAWTGNWALCAKELDHGH